MPLNLTRVRTILMDVPRHGKLAYCLLRDERVPAAPKVALLGALGVVFSPIDLPAWIPVLGELDMLALAILAVKVFVDACPEDVVREHEAAIRSGESIFDHDLGGAAGAAVGAVRGAVDRWGGSMRGRLRVLSQDSEDRSA
jgi:uncharacterized membrane protein YkvA (DUF1232 family)